MSQEFDLDRFNDRLRLYRLLNPEGIETIENELFDLAQVDTKQAFQLVASTATDVVKLYVASPVKRAERASFDKYFQIISQSAKQLEAGLPEPLPSNVSGVALVPAKHYSSLQWMRIELAANVPDPVANAVAAGKRRNELLESILESIFRLLLRLDEDAGISWSLALCDETEEPIDPDVARDLIRAWKQLDTVPPKIITQLLTWSTHELTVRHWPMVAAEADALLRRDALSKAGDTLPPSLQRLKPFTRNSSLLRWLRSCVSSMGESISFFCAQAEILDKEKESADEWRREAMFQELLKVQRNIPSILVLSDMLLDHPDGSLDFSMAVFGFTHRYKKMWRERLIEQCRKAVRACFLRDMRFKRKPAHTIHLLSFGDDVFEANVRADLDLVTESFTTISQREDVVEKLAYMYASYREEPLLMQEIGLRYRKMMRMLHEDNLNRLLTPEQMKSLGEGGDALTELSDIASHSRRFIMRRRALDRSTEEMLAADLDYWSTIKSLRAHYLRQIFARHTP